MSEVALCLACAWMAFGLYAIGALLENRPWALGVELARLAMHWPAFWLASALDLLPMGALGWAGLALYTLASLAALWGLPRREAALAT